MLTQTQIKVILDKAQEAGTAALKAATPTPMIVTLNTPTEKKNYFVEGGCCGFAWVSVTSDTKENRAFLNAAKKYFPGIFKPAYGGGFQKWIHEGGQSMTRKECFAAAYAKVLRDAGITAYSDSRID